MIPINAADYALLEAVCRGRKLPSIAREMGTTEAGARMRLHRLRQRFDCQTTAQLLAHLFRTGRIQ